MTRTVYSIQFKQYKLQPIRDLFIRDVNCKQFEKADVFHMSHKCENILLWDSVLPSSTLDHLFQQISTCSTLQTIEVRDTNLGEIAKNHQTDITVVIYFSNLSNAFYQNVRKYTESSSLLHIYGESPDINIADDLKSKKNKLTR